MFTFEQIKELIELVGDHGLQGLEVERSGFRIQITGKGGAAPLAIPAPQPVAVSTSPAPQAVAMLTPPVAAPAPEPAAEEPIGHVLESPIVGTFYEAPSPEAGPFVRVGDRVKKGQVLCIVEAMKLMNEIEADIDGEITRIFPENAQPVEYGEPLFAIKA
ncbi:MAG: acetyl-CoA carboxylase biotin carboxyl carrier protein [Thermoanaerobaculia bacterium]|nr:acetyl-CoA carboxylase biotin carboxyl carrier protein [Thermoanaerobaculia bacterium]